MLKTRKLEGWRARWSGVAALLQPGLGRACVLRAGGQGRRLSNVSLTRLILWIVILTQEVHIGGRDVLRARYPLDIADCRPRRDEKLWVQQRVTRRVTCVR